MILFLIYYLGGENWRAWNVSEVFTWPSPLGQHLPHRPKNKYVDYSNCKYINSNYTFRDSDNEYWMDPHSGNTVS